MVRRQQTDLEILFQEALRKRIGEKRHQFWFASGARFAFEGSELSVEVDSPFMVDWIVNSGYVHIFEQIGLELFATEIKVNVSLKGSKGTYGRSVPFVASSASQPTFEPPARVSSAVIGDSNRSVFSESESSAPPKRKRGRPRKNPIAEPVLQERAVGDGFAQDVLFDLPSIESDVLLNERRLAERTPIAPLAEVSVPEPPRRRRGRPRKNPAPEQERAGDRAGVANGARLSIYNPDSEPTQSSVRQAPFYASAETTSPNSEPRSFLDAYQSEQRRRALDALTPPSEARFVNSGGIDLSESERALWTVGDFEADERETTIQPREPSRQFGDRVPGNFPTLDGEPRRRGRGRPKGSTNRKSTNVERPGLFPTAPDDEEEIVSRDSKGHNVVARPKESTPRLKSEDRAVRFASLNTFVEGFSNTFARNVVNVAIAQPGAMSPVFIYGSTSVGKTHLLEGICDAYSRKPGAKPPLYMTSEQFTSAFIHSLRGGGSFRDRFKEISLFALDDIHFLEGKTSTQTELLNVVDFLRARGVQIVFSANKPLKDLVKLRGELTTRIESGVVCDIKNPERETLARILRQMALERKIIIGDDVCRYVVSRFATHARQLSGALNRLLATHWTTGAPVNMDLAREALADLATSNIRNVRLDDVERVVQEVFGLESNALKSSSRAKKCSDPRAVAMWIARKHTRAALAEIGNFFGGRKHSAVLSAQKKVDEWIKRGETLDASGASISVNEAIERVERALSYPLR